MRADLYDGCDCGDAMLYQVGGGSDIGSVFRKMTEMAVSTGRRIESEFNGSWIAADPITGWHAESEQYR